MTHGTILPGGSNSSRSRSSCHQITGKHTSTRMRYGALTMRASTRPSGWSRSTCGRAPQDHSASGRIAILTTRGQPTSGTVSETARELVQQTAERRTHHRLDVCRVSLIVWKVHVPIALMHGEPVHPALQSRLNALARKTGHKELT